MNLRTIWMGALFGALLGQSVAAEPRWIRVEEELGEALGFSVLKVEVEHGKDEVLVVREEVRNPGGEDLVKEHYLYGRNMPVTYRVVLVDSSGFMPGERHVILKLSGGSREMRDTELTRQEYGPGRLHFEFTDAKTYAPKGSSTWTAKIETLDEFARRHAGFTHPSRKPAKDAGGWSQSGSFVVKGPGTGAAR